MHLAPRSLSLRLAAVLAAAALAGCAGDTAAPVAPVASSRLASSSPSAPYGVDASAIELRPGATQQLSVTKVANGKDAPITSYAWSTADSAVATVSDAGLVTAIAGGETTVSATRGAHRVDVHVTVIDPCRPVPMGLGTTTGEITADDCLFSTLTGRRGDYYSFQSVQGQLLEVVATGVDGPNGIKEATADPRVGIVYASRTPNTRYRFITNGDPLQFFIGGRDSTKLGAYSVTRSVGTETHSCSNLTFVMPGTTFSATLTQANSCHYPVEFSNVPAAIGKPLAAHDYWVRLEAGHTHTITLTGLSDSFDPALTIFPNILNGAPVASAIPGPLPSPGTRSVTFTPATSGYYLIEVAAGRFVDNLVTWSVQTGTFTLSVSR